MLNYIEHILYVYKIKLNLIVLIIYRCRKNIILKCKIFMCIFIFVNVMRVKQEKLYLPIKIIVLSKIFKNL